MIDRLKWIGIALIAITTTARAQCQIEAGFSPGGDAEALVLRTINDARSSLNVAAYSFTSPLVVRALVAASRRGVKVQVLADRLGNTGAANIAAINLLVNAGIPARVIGSYAIHHDKYIVADGVTVQTGSFNYTRAAATRNSENVIVARACPPIAQQYLDHWRIRWKQGAEWQSTY